MNTITAIAPIFIAATAWYGLYRLNRRKGWFRIGEVIFWDAIVLVLVYLVWLRWF